MAISVQSPFTVAGVLLVANPSSTLLLVIGCWRGKARQSVSRRNALFCTRFVRAVHPWQNGGSGLPHVFARRLRVVMSACSHHKRPGTISVRWTPGLSLSLKTLGQSLLRVQAFPVQESRRTLVKTLHLQGTAGFYAGWLGSTTSRVWAVWL